MKFNLHLSLLLAAALVCGGASAKTKKVKKAAKNQTAKVDTVAVSTFSYAAGMANTQGLKQYIVGNLKVDTAYIADFLKGVNTETLTENEKKMQAFCAGLQIREQLNGRMLPSMNSQITDDPKKETIDKVQYMKGFTDGVNNNFATMDMTRADSVTRHQMEYYRKTLNEKKYGANRIAGEEYLKNNKKKEGVKTTKSGLQYKVLTKGTGILPTDTSTVKVNYEGKLIDGTVFDSSYKRNKPASFRCNQVIKGWTEALTMMPVGSKWEIYVPQELGYGDREAGKIKPFSALIFTVELLETSNDPNSAKAKTSVKPAVKVDGKTAATKKANAEKKVALPATKATSK